MQIQILLRVKRVMWRHVASVSIVFFILVWVAITVDGGGFVFREGLAKGSTGCDTVSVDCVWFIARCRYQREDGEGRFRTAVQLDDREGVVGGASGRLELTDWSIEGAHAFFF